MEGNRKKIGIVRKISPFFFIIILLFFGYLVFAESPGLVINTRWQENLVGTVYGSTIWGDVDNDGDLDLAMMGCVDGGGSSCGTNVDDSIFSIYINNGTSLIENMTWQQNFTNISTGSIAFGDVDNDGDLDLVATGCTAGGGRLGPCNAWNSSIYRNNGTSFVEDTTWGGNLTDVWESTASFGDVDNDGDLDLVATGRNNGDFAMIYINNGTAFLENTTWQQNLTGIYRGGAVFGDIDNDGDLDLIFSGQTGTSTDTLAKIYLNNGTSFVEDTTWGKELVGKTYSSLAIGDLDNDGDLDLVQIGLADSFNIYRNNGTSLFLNKTKNNGLGGGYYIGSMGLGDHDNDGDLDVAGTGREEGRNHIFQNNQGDIIADNIVSANFSEDLIQGSLAWTDIDNDNDLDIVLTGLRGISFLNAQIFISNKSLTQPNVPPLAPTNFSNYSTNATNGRMVFTWANASDNATPAVGLYYNLRVGTASGGHQIVSGVYGGGEDNGYLGNMMQRTNATLNIPDRNYYWAVQAIDTSLKAGNWSAEQFYNTSPSITLNSPGDYANFSNSTIIFNISSSDNVNLSNVTLYGNWSGTFAVNETNLTIAKNSNQTFNVTLNEGIQIFAVRVCDTSHNCLITQNRTLTIDSHSPAISSVSPLNTSTIESSSVVATVTYSDFTITTCQARIDSGAWQEMVGDNTRGGTANYTFTSVTDAQHTIETNCTDSLSNSTINTTTFTVDSGIADTTAPAITLSSPANSSNFSTSSVSVTANYTDQNNVQCAVRINSGSWFNMDGDGGTSGTVNYTFNSLSDSHSSTINVNCTDSESNANIINTTVMIDATSPSVKLNYPLQGQNFSSTSITFNFTAIDLNLQRCRLYGNWTTGWHLNQTISASNNTQTNFTSFTLNEGSFIWNVYCNDSLGNSAYNETNLTFRIDTTRPSIFLVSPANASTQTSSSTVTFTYNVSDAAIQNCSLFIDGSLDQTGTSITTGTSQTFSKSLGNADYNWNVNCTDYANNANASQTFKLTVNVASGGGTSTGGGGGGGGAAVSKFDVDFSVSNSKEVTASKGSSVSLSFDGTTGHKIKVNDVTADSATITISSDPVTITLSVGETKEIDINQDAINDLSVKLTNIAGETVSLSIGKLAGADILAKKTEKKKTFSNRDEIRAMVTQGETAKESFIITNYEDKKLGFKLELSELTEHVLLSDWEFSLNPGESRAIDAHFVAASDEEPGKKTGKIRIHAGSKQEDVMLVMEVKKREGLFDVKVKIPEKFKLVFLGDEVTSEITLTNLGKIGKVDVALDYSLRDSQGNVITSAADTLAVETVTSFIRTLRVPKALAEGNYTFFVDVTYKDVIAHGKDNFFAKAERPGFVQRRFKEIVISILLISVIGFMIYFIIFKKEVLKEEDKLEKEVKKLKKRE